MTHGEANQFRDGESFRQHLVEKTKALIFPAWIDFSGESELAFRGSRARVPPRPANRRLKLGALCLLGASWGRLTRHRPNCLATSGGAGAYSRGSIEQPANPLLRLRMALE